MPQAEHSGSTPHCLHCAHPMDADEVVRHPNNEGPVIEMFKCPNESCGRRAALMFEPRAGLTEADQSWVEREVEARGAFFPTDFTGGRSRFRRL